MKIYTQSIDGVMVAFLDGELTSATSGHAFEELSRIATSGETRVVFHLGELRAVTRAGARCLVVAAKLINMAGGETRICRAAPMVGATLERLGFNHLFAFYGGLQSALAAHWRDKDDNASDAQHEEMRIAI